MTNLWEAQVDINGGGAHGTLKISGFAASNTARDLGEAFGELCKERWPGAEVLVSLKIGQQFVEEK